ncbi:MAG TPA: PAS domain S-box protein [Gemmatimonadaceae bacterium]|nr:PAS domain S-box protein [Gemmatimonadaceae bacterium]
MIPARSTAVPSDDSLARWYATSLARRVILVLSGIALGLITHAVGLIDVPLSVFVVLGVWLALGAGVFIALRERPAGPLVWRVHMAAHAADIVGTLTLTHLLGATSWLAPLLLVMSIVHGGQMLPRLNAVVLGAIAAIGYSVTIIAEVRGFVDVRGPFAPSLLPTHGAAYVAAAVVSFGILAIALIQRGFHRQVAAIDERYARLLEAASEVIVTVDMRGRFLTMNLAFEKLLGWSREKVLGQEFLEFVDDVDKQRVAERFNAVLGGETINTDVRIRTADGRVVLLSATGTPIRDENGDVVAALGVSRDVTERRADAERLAANERQLRLLIRSMNETVFTMDAQHRFTSIYGRWAPRTPIDSADAIGKTFTEVIGAAQAAGLDAPLARALNGEHVQIEHDVTYGDDTRHYRVSFTPLRDDEDTIVGVTGVSWNITDQRRAERERDVLSARLEESRRIEAIGRLVSGVAHEINNPLAAILTFAEQLRSEARNPVDEAALEAIHAEAIRSRAIVRDLLAFVRPSTQRPMATVRAGPLLEGTVRSLRPHLGSLGVELTCDARDESVWVTADVPGLEQVVTNLVLNGAQAAGPGGRVHVHTESTPSTFVFVVDDTGSGIPVSAMPHLFEPFFTTKPSGEGTGLGLFVALGIMQRHGGTLRGENRPDTRGARFTVEVPRAAAPEDRSAAPREQAALSPRVLIVDDEESIRASLRRYFVRRGWDVTDVEDGAKALDVLRKEGGDAFVIVMCDLRMPGMSGAEFHERVETELPEVLSRLVLVSGDVVSPDAASLVARTKCRVLEKPFELRMLGVLADEMIAEQGPDRPETPE